MRTLMALRVRPCLVCTGFLFNATPAEVPVPVPRAVQREVVVDRHIPVPHPVPVMQQPVMQQPVVHWLAFAESGPARTSIVLL